MMPPPIEDGRDAAERRCTPLACATEHCLQQHKYQMTPPCEAKWALYTACVAEWREKLGLGAAPAPQAAPPSPSAGGSKATCNT